MRSIRLPMNPLDFEALTQLGRSIIPAAAPKWTDHNTHDPGIMLLELLAWIAEAQMYGISRSRKDERLAFAQLLGLAPRGPLPASGLVWATRGISPSPWAAGFVVQHGTPVTPDLLEPPRFFTTASVELTTAVLRAVVTHFHDGRTTDWTAANTRDGATFMPFGAAPVDGDRLALEFDGPLVGDPAKDAVISIGVHIINPDRTESTRVRHTALLEATLTTNEGERPLRIAADTSGGLLHTGVLLLRIPAGAVGDNERSVISLRSASGGFMRAPRFQQIAPNVLPIEQVAQAIDLRPFGNGLPDQTFVLQHQGLLFPVGDRPFTVSVHEGSALNTWTRVMTFDESGPDDTDFVLDERNGVLHFGNGVNGKCVARDSTINVQYSVSDGVRGNQPANLRWTVEGIAGWFGSNVVAMEGGADARGLADLRRLARQRIATAKPIVTSADLEEATRTFKDLGVTRARELPPPAGCAIRGTRILLVVGPHQDGEETARTESDEFLAEIHARLRPRLALGQTLAVIPPRYVTVWLTASVVAAPRVDPDELRANIVEALQRRLAIVPNESSKGWPFGRDLTATAIGGWMRKVEGVAGVGEVTLASDPPSASTSVVALGPTALPILDVANSAITIERSVHRSLHRSRSGTKP
jgi:hypothetical protein